MMDSDADDVLRRRPLLALDDVELDLLALGQVLEPAALARGWMNETVLLSVFPSDESEALRLIEPLDCAFGTHVLPLLCSLSRRTVPIYLAFVRERALTMAFHNYRVSSLLYPLQQSRSRLYSKWRVERYGHRRDQILASRVREEV